MSDLDSAYRRIVGQDAERSALITDPTRPDNPIVFVSDAFLVLTGYGRDEVLGRNCRFLQGPDTDPRAIEDIRRAIRERRALTRDILNYRKDGTPFWNRLRIRPMFARDGTLERFVGVQNEIAASDVRDRPIDGFAD